MKLLKQLLPVEALLLTEAKTCNTGRYLKATMMDLLLKQVLKSTSNNGVTDSPESPTDKWIGPGKHYYTYQPAIHEKPLLALFDTASGTYGREYFLFSQVVKVAYQKAGIVGLYRKKIYRNSSNAQWYNQSLWVQLFGGFSLTADGKQAQQQLKAEIALLETQLSDYLVNDLPKAQQLLQEIKGHVFLLKNIDLSKLDMVEKDMVIAINQSFLQKEDSVGDSSMVAGCSTWSSYGDYSDSWDSSCSSGCSSGDSGGGDGSGCSSGCGGCGGGCGGGGD